MLEEIKKYDSNFNESVFINKADRIFIMILDAIMEKNINNIKHYISDNVYNDLNQLVSSYNEKNIIRIFDEMNIKSTEIMNVNIYDNKLFITVKLISRYMDYFIDPDTGNYISGINDHRIETEHIIEFVKNIDAKEIGITINCNTCGNSMNVNDSGICPFCKNIIDMSKYDYIIHQFII